MIIEFLDIRGGRVVTRDTQEIPEEEIKRVGVEIGIDFSKVCPKQFVKGYKVELEHGVKDPETNVTNNDPAMTAKIAWAHLKELPEYYDKLEKLEGKK